MGDSYYAPGYLHETLNVYISQDTYVFEPATFPTTRFGADGSLGSASLDEKVVRETLTVDRRTGKMTLNALNSGPPLGGSERVITCFGIVGFITLATSE